MMRCPTCLRLGFAGMVCLGLAGGPGHHPHTPHDPAPPHAPRQVSIGATSSSGSAVMVGQQVGAASSPSRFGIVSFGLGTICPACQGMR